MFFTNVSIFAETCRYFFQKKQVLQDSKADLVIFRMNNVQTRLDVVGLGERKMYKSKGYNSMGQDRDDIVIAHYTTVMKRILAIDYIQGIFASAITEEQTEDAIEEIKNYFSQNIEHSSLCSLGWKQLTNKEATVKATPTPTTPAHP